MANSWPISNSFVSCSLSS